MHVLYIHIVGVILQCTTNFKYLRISFKVEISSHMYIHTFIYDIYYIRHMYVHLHIHIFLSVMSDYGVCYTQFKFMHM